MPPNHELIVNCFEVRQYLLYGAVRKNKVGVAIASDSTLVITPQNPTQSSEVPHKHYAD